MTLRTGVDLMEISRLREAAERHGERFFTRIYTPAERALCAGNYSSLAARFAAKEAISKTLGTGVGDIAWTEMEILRAPSGEPYLILHGKARTRAEELGLAEWSISLSHSRDLAIAMVVAQSQK